MSLTDAEYEAKFDEFQRLGGIVKSPPVPKLYIGAAKWKPDRMPDPDNRDKDGNSLDILELERQYQSKEIKPDVDYTKIGRSFNLNMINMQAHLFLGVGGTNTTYTKGNLNLKGLNGTVYNPGNEGWGWVQVLEASYGDYTQYGIHIGTDGTATAETDYMCIARIDHGDSAGEMRYWDMYNVSHSYDGGTKKWSKQWVRFFTNHSGGSITVREMILCGRISYGSSPTNVYASVARDLLSPAVAVGNLEILRLVYTFTFDSFDS